MNSSLTVNDAAEILRARRLAPTAESAREIAERWADEARAKAFFSARVTSAALLSELHKRVMMVVEGKINREGARALIRQFLKSDGDALLQQCGFLPQREALKKESLRELASTARLNLIIDTNVRTACATGEYRRAVDGKKWFPLVRYKTAEDDRVRASHRVLDNKIYPVDSDEAARVWPPRDFRCRCYVVRVSAAEARDIKPDSGLPPQFTDAQEAQVFQFDPRDSMAEPPPEGTNWPPGIKKAYNDDVINIKWEPVPSGQSGPSGRSGQAPAPEPQEPPAAPSTSSAPEAVRAELEKKLDSAGLERFKPELEKIPDKALAVPAPEIKPGFDASYSRAKKTITLDKDPGFTGGRPEALHHEWAHHLHYEIETVTNSSVDAALDKAMQNDYNDWLRAAKLKHGPEFESKLKFIDVEKMSKAQRPLYEAALQEHAQDAGYQLDLSRRASEERIRALLYFDTIGAISKGEYGWGHSKEAYSANNGGAKEAFANIYTAFIRGWTEFAIFAETLKWIRDKFQQ